MTSDVKIEGLPELRDMLTHVVPREATNILRRTVTRIAAEVRKATREELARKTRRRTGNLERSIKSKRDRGQKNVTEASVYVDRSGGRTGKGYHWHFIEYGTVNMAARPFITPTVERWRSRMPDEVVREFGAQFEREMARKAKKAVK